MPFLFFEIVKVLFLYFLILPLTQNSHTPLFIHFILLYKFCTHFCTILSLQHCLLHVVFLHILGIHALQHQSVIVPLFEWEYTRAKFLHCIRSLVLFLYFPALLSLSLPLFVVLMLMFSHKFFIKFVYKN